jgi:hypothetical protein
VKNHHRPLGLDLGLVHLSEGLDVVGMTNGACHGPSYLPDGILGISTTLGLEDRLRSEGRLHRGEPEPGDEDKSPPMAISPKVG